MPPPPRTSFRATASTNRAVDRTVAGRIYPAPTYNGCFGVGDGGGGCPQIARITPGPAGCNCSHTDPQRRYAALPVGHIRRLYVGAAYLPPARTSLTATASTNRAVDRTMAGGCGNPPLHVRMVTPTCPTPSTRVFPRDGGGPDISGPCI